MPYYLYSTFTVEIQYDIPRVQLHEKSYCVNTVKVMQLLTWNIL